MFRRRQLTPTELSEFVSETERERERERGREREREGGREAGLPGFSRPSHFSASFRARILRSLAVLHK